MPTPKLNNVNISSIRHAWDTRKDTYLLNIKKAAPTTPTVTPRIEASAIKVPKVRFKEYTGTEGWHVKKLKDIARFQSGKSHEKLLKKEGEGDYTVVNLDFISSNGMNVKTADKKLASLNKQDIAIVMRDTPKKGNLAKCFYVPKDDTFTLNKHVGRLSIATENPLFCYYQINKNEYFKKFDIGYKRINLNKKKVNNCQIFLPSIEEQNKIADIMQDIEKCISIQRRKVKKAASIAQEAVAEFMKDKTWEWTSIRELVDKHVVTLSRGDILVEHKKSSVYNIPIYTDRKRDILEMTYSDKYMYDQELITWAIDGGANINYIRKQKCNVTTDCGIIQLDESKYSYKFAYEMLKLQEEENKRASDVRVYSYQFSHLYKLPVVSIEKQEEINAWFKEIFLTMHKEERELEKLLRKKLKLLEELFV